MYTIHIGVGSNIEPRHNIPKAIALLAEEVHILRVSTFYWTEALQRRHDPLFLNGALLIETERAPELLKQEVLRKIEAALGRKRTQDRYAPREIDLDIALAGDLLIKTRTLKVPDPEIRERLFLALALLEITPDDYVLPDKGDQLVDIINSMTYVEEYKPAELFSQLLKKRWEVA